MADPSIQPEGANAAASAAGRDPETMDFSHEFLQTHISAGKYVLLRLPSENFKLVQLHAGSVVSLGKFGRFNVDDILGHPFGFTYEIGDNEKLRIVRSEFELDGTEQNISVDLGPDENNRELLDDPDVQALGTDEIEALKKQGLSGQEIIERVKSSHASFEKKTMFSQEKYIKRKQQKFLQRFTPEAIGSNELIDIYLDKDPGRIQSLSAESLGLVMSQANIQPGGTYLVVDDLSSVIVASMMERMGGDGTIVHLHENEHPNVDALRYMNYSEGLRSKMIKPVNLVDFFHPDETDNTPVEEKTPAELEAMKSSQRGQYYRRRARRRDFELVQRLVAEHRFDALVVASELHLPSLLERLISLVAGSAPIVVYSEHKELLIDVSHMMQRDPNVLAPTIMETRVRKYQTLPGRMHPHMTSRGIGGYVLWGIRVLPTRVNAISQKSKKRKLEEKAKAAAASDASSDVNTDDVEMAA